MEAKILKFFGIRFFESCGIKPDTNSRPIPDPADQIRLLVLSLSELREEGDGIYPVEAAPTVIDESEDPEIQISLAIARLARRIR